MPVSRWQPLSRTWARPVRSCSGGPWRCARRSMWRTTSRCRKRAPAQARRRLVLLRDDAPRLVGIETLHLLELGERRGTQVLLIHDTGVTYHEGLHARL